MTESTTVLVVEDETPMRKFLRTSLSTHGYNVLEASTGSEGLRLTTTHRPDLILLDLGLADGDGIDLANKIREWSAVPIIVISARRRQDDKVAVLDAGADDYLTKPFGVRELLARMRVALRHAKTEPASPIIEIDPLAIDLGRRLVTLRGERVRLTPTEYKLLVYLAKHAGRVLTHEQILKEVWGNQAMQHHYVRVYIAELRRKLEEDVARPKLILTEPGIGYRMGYS